MKELKVYDHTIGKADSVYFIAEMSANHAGSKERALEIVHAAKEAGADCVKIQTYTPDTMTIDCQNDYFNLKSGTWAGENLYRLYQKAYTPWEWQADIKAEAEKIGLDFFSTPFDLTSVDFLEEIGVSFYKIASFELIDIPLIRYVASKKKPMIVSTGMGNVGEIQEAVDAIRSMGNDQIALLKCTSAYPADCSHMNLRTLPNMKEMFDVPVGLSDHSLGSTASIAAVCMGATIIEKHFGIDRKIDNPDASFSMEPAEYKKMVEEVRNGCNALGTVSYHVNEAEMSDYTNRRSIFVVKDIKKGETLTKENVRIIRPGFGLVPKYYDMVLGQHALVELKRGTPLSFEIIGG